MVRRVSLWCTAFILLTTLASLGIAGCGGGSGDSGKARTSSRDLFGNLTVRVTREEGPVRVQVQGDTILLATSSSAQRLVVELFPLPVHSPPTPLMARSFDLVDGRGQVVIDQIPAPARYMVRGYLYEGANPEYTASFLVEDIEILPGVVASASTSLTPRPSVSPTVSPSPGGPLFQVGTGSEPHVAMRGDGHFVVSWQSTAGVFARAFLPGATPSPKWDEKQISTDGSGAPPSPKWDEKQISTDGSGAPYTDPVPAIHPSSDLFGVAWVQSTSGMPGVWAAYCNLGDGSSAGDQGVLESASTEDLASTGFGIPGDAGDPPATPVVNFERSSGTASMMRSYQVPAPDVSSDFFRDSLVGAASPALDVDVNGDCAEVYHEGGQGTLKLRVSKNDAAGPSTISVGGAGAADFVRPSVAIRNGRIAVAWLDFTGSVMTIYVQRFQYTPGSTVLTPVPLDSIPHAVSQDLTGISNTEPDVAMDGEGNCVVVWRHWPIESSKAVIVGRPLNSDGSLQPHFQASVDNSVDYAWPSVGMDSSGNYVVCWGVWDSGTIYGRRYPSSFVPGVGI